MELERIIKEVIDLSRSIGDWMFDERKQFSEERIESKSFNNLVSYVDEESEKRFVEGLNKILPTAGILGEEGVDNKSENEDLRWIIDPLDGTTNYIHGVPAYCTSVALEKEGQIILGVIYEPNRKECFYAFEGGGAFLNGIRIQVTNTNDLKSSLLATGFPYDYFDRMDNYMELLKHLMKNTRGIRRIGAAALDLCYVACGRFDAFFELALQPWDVAAGSIIVKEAGGQCTDFSGGQAYIYGKSLVSSNLKVHEQILNSIKDHE
ncbi:inositol monophosphatase family protein [Parvicella tangerina]|uniref:Inositol-1-monophosphatase n=1 Tax=Parvicella tangerina TaxID=2829795 RepID=A0A916JKV9_9FLAO|nr:inositol monophosphatase family protein [Parvicella tangerina]CAG5078237.1 Inositol-1-monophosphatase [Parvicella tangerina]